MRFFLFVAALPALIVAQKPAARSRARDLRVTPPHHAVVDATEDAIYNSLFVATTTTSRGRAVEAIPLDSVRAILSCYKVTAR